MINKVEYRMIFADMIREIPQAAEFFKNPTSTNFYSLELPASKWGDENDIVVETMCGCTKGCFAFDDEYIFKIGFTNTERIEEDNDFCKKEYENWLEIKDTKYAEAFVSMNILGEICGNKIYYTERVLVNEEQSESIAVESLMETGEYDNEEAAYDDICCGDEELVCEHVMGSFFSDIFVGGLMELIRNLHINDLHGGNIGFRQNGMPCIIDYSGF